MGTFTNDGLSDDGIQGLTESHDSNALSGVNSDGTARNASTPKGNGVFGTTQVPDGAGVFGLHAGGGVGVVGFGLPAGTGVVGISVPDGAKGGDGVFGVSNSEHRNGVVGVNESTDARKTADAGGNGVFGLTEVPDGAGVFGAHTSTGIGVAGVGLIGVSGGSVNGVGVMGVSAPVGAKGGDGVQGITNSETKNGIYGRNVATTKHGTPDPVGNGVFGFSDVPDGAGVFGANGKGGAGVAGTGETGVIGTGAIHGVRGVGPIGIQGVGSAIGVWGLTQNNGMLAGRFTGPVLIEGRSDITADLNIFGGCYIAGNLTVSGDILCGNKDIAERFQVDPAVNCERGMVMVIEGPETLSPCTRAYDKRAVGVISGAGTLRPAITLGEDGNNRNTVKIALVGTVNCWVDADQEPIEIGDLITTSATTGHGMKARDREASYGATIGKALAPLSHGRGMIPIVLSLQ